MSLLLGQVSSATIKLGGRKRGHNVYNGMQKGKKLLFRYVGFSKKKKKRERKKKNKGKEKGSE